MLNKFTLYFEIQVNISKYKSNHQSSCTNLHIKIGCVYTYPVVSFRYSGILIFAGHP